MSLFYKKINIEDFEGKQEELLGLASTKFKDATLLCYYDPGFDEMKSKCPTLYKYISERSKIPIRFFRIYHTPAHGFLNKHIDGATNFRAPIGLNLPILNCKNTLMKWWDETNAHMISGTYGYGGVYATKIANPNELTCMDQVEIDVPTFVRTDYIHSIENYNDKPRILMSIRWNYDQTTGQNFDDVMDYDLN